MGLERIEAKVGPEEAKGVLGRMTAKPKETVRGGVEWSKRSMRTATDSARNTRGGKAAMTTANKALERARKLPVVGGLFEESSPSEGTGQQVVYYRPPEKVLPEVRRLRALLIVAGVLSLVSAGQLFLTMANLGEVSETARTEAEGQQETLTGLIQFVQENDPDNEVGLNDLDPEAFIGRIVDGLRVFDNVIWLVATVAMALVIYIPIRYVRLVRAMAGAHPNVWWQIRGLARLQLGVEAVKLVGISWIGDGVETINVAYSIGPAVFVAPLVLMMLKKPQVRAYFSHHEFVPVAGATTKWAQPVETAAPNPATPAGPFPNPAPAAAEPVGQPVAAPVRPSEPSRDPDEDERQSPPGDAEQPADTGADDAPPRDDDESRRSQDSNSSIGPGS